MTVSPRVLGEARSDESSARPQDDALLHRWTGVKA